MHPTLMIPSYSDLVRVLDNLSTEGRLDCVVAGETIKGEPAPRCPSIISNPWQMCAGCAASAMKYRAGLAVEVGGDPDDYPKTKGGH